MTIIFLTCLLMVAVVVGLLLLILFMAEHPVEAVIGGLILCLTVDCIHYFFK